MNRTFHDTKTEGYIKIMKKSEELHKQANEEDNDFKALSLYTKSLREGRLENFQNTYLQVLLKKGYEVAEDNYKYTIDTNDKFGIIDFFPKANKLLIRKDNKWIKPGTQWIIKNLLT